MIAPIVIVVLVLIAAAVYFYIHFNRDPPRTIPPGKSVVSPADGRIIEIIDLLKLKSKKQKLDIKKGLIGKIRTMAGEVSDHCYAVVIFMSPKDVHVQRAPVDGKVLSVKHHKGKFIPANSLKATVENEKTEIVMRNKDIGKLKIILAAGFFTRRIVSFVKKNEKLLKGQKIGRIKLGSQVVLIMPDIHLQVRKGDKVTAGETIIAEY
jgi:phosphatidylserine decarboxylase